MKISKQARRDGKQLFKSTFANGVMDEGRVREAVRLLAAQKPRGYAGVLAHMGRLVKLETDRRTARIESATPLDAAAQAAVQTNLTRRYGAGLHVNFVQTPALLGGLRVQVGSDVYDGSVQARLARLGESF